MSTLYPYEQDRIRRWVKDVDDMVAGDLNDLFDIAVAIETELGIQPSGKFGTVEARLFSLGNISLIDGRFRRLQWWIKYHQVGSIFSDTGFGLIQNYQGQRFANRTTVFGEGVPGIFVALQAPLSTTIGTGGYGGVPWALSVAILEKDFFVVFGSDGYGTSLHKGRLSTTNQATAIQFASLAWNMY